MRSIHSNADLSKQTIIAQVIQQMPAEIDFTQKEMNELYHLSVEWNINDLNTILDRQKKRLKDEEEEN